MYCRKKNQNKTKICDLRHILFYFCQQFWHQKSLIINHKNGWLYKFYSPVLFIIEMMTLTLRIPSNNKDPNLGVKPMKKELKQLDIEELNLLSARIDSDPDQVAALLFPDQPMNHVSVTEKIGQWAINQTAVIESVRNDKPDVATIFKKVGNRIWQQLPPYAQSVQVKIE